MVIRGYATPWGEICEKNKEAVMKAMVLLFMLVASVAYGYDGQVVASGDWYYRAQERNRQSNYESNRQAQYQRESAVATQQAWGQLNSYGNSPYTQNCDD